MICSGQNGTEGVILDIYSSPIPVLEIGIKEFLKITSRPLYCKRGTLLGNFIPRVLLFFLKHN